MKATNYPSNGDIRTVNKFLWLQRSMWSPKWRQVKTKWLQRANFIQIYVGGGARTGIGGWWSDKEWID